MLDITKVSFEPIIKEISESVTWILYAQPLIVTLFVVAVVVLYKGVVLSKVEQVESLKSTIDLLNEKIKKLEETQSTVLLKKYNDFLSDFEKHFKKEEERIEKIRQRLVLEIDRPGYKDGSQITQLKKEFISSISLGGDIFSEENYKADTDFLEGSNPIQSMYAKIIDSIYQLIFEGVSSPTVKNVVDKLGCEFDEINRFIDYSGVHYEDMLDETRRNYALISFNDGKSDEGVSLQLGYESVFAFQDDFKKWTGIRTSDFRGE